MTTTDTRTLVRSMPRSGRGATHYGEPTGRGNIKLACTGRTAYGYVLDPAVEHHARHVTAGVTCRSCAGNRQTPIRDAAPLLHPSLLSARDRATMTPEAQIHKLARIGRRAMAHADWIDELISLNPTLDRAERSRDVRESRAKAAAAADEMLRIARTAGIRPHVTSRF